MIDQAPSITQRLDAVKGQTSKGVEYWHARDLMPVLGYDTWRRFEEAIERAKSAYTAAGEVTGNHFVETGKMVVVGSGAQRQVTDYYLSRPACYLIAMNGDTTKPEIAEAQMYFAVQTRRMEMQDQAIEDQRRVHLRDRVRTANKKLNEAAQHAGVRHFGPFHDAGYRALYKLSYQDIKKRKGLDKKDHVLDRAGRAELAANDFRITQTEQKLVRDGIHGQQKASDTHYAVAATVRATIEKIGGTLPEDLPPAPHIKQIEKRVKVRELGKPPPK